MQSGTPKTYRKGLLLLGFLLASFTFFFLLVRDRSDRDRDNESLSPDNLLHRSERAIQRCQEVVTNGSGIIQSPGFPNNYPDNIDCWTQIIDSEGKRIHLYFNTIDLEYGNGCEIDYVRIFDGETQNAPLLGQICRQSEATRFESSSNSLLIHFHSDESENRKGYSAMYSSVDERNILEGDCMLETGESNGTIISPNYPGNYPRNSNCTIWIRAPEGQRIFIIIDELHLEMEANCYYDYLRIKEGPPPDSKVMETYCGRLLQSKKLTTNESQVEIHFHSDDTIEESGFKLRYWFLSNETETETEKFVPSSTKLMFSQIPENATVLVGSSHMLQCSTQYPNAETRWYKGHLFLNSSNILPGLSVFDNGTLWIQSIDHHLHGIYTCSIVTAEDMVTAKAYIAVEDVEDKFCKIVFRKIRRDQVVTEGDYAGIQCVVDERPVSISWEKDGRPLNSHGNIVILSSNYVFIENVMPQNAGVYTCVAADASDGCVKKTSVLLQVNERAKVEEICGKPKITSDLQLSYIVGGRDATKGAYPWQVMLWEPSWKSFCGGSLLNERWIVTAAHCFDESEESSRTEILWNQIIIKLGKHNREQEEISEFQTVIADKSFIKKHPHYNKVTLDNDLALIRLRDHVHFTDYILPICLGDTNLTESLLSADAGKIKMGTAIGWGRMSENGLFPKNLQEIKLPIVEQNKCIASVRDNKSTVTDNMFCAGYDEDTLGGDTCQGDSGGPFFMKYKGRYYLLGIVSWGEGCGRANNYGFYTRISNYVSWIKSTITS